MPSRTEVNLDTPSENPEQYKPVDRQAEVLRDEEYIQNRIDVSVDRLNVLSSQNQSKYKKLKRAAIIIGATIPLCVTLTTIDYINNVPWFKIPLLVYSALGGTVLALMNNLLKTGNFYDNWKSFRSISETLLREKYLYLTKMPPYNKNDAFPLVVEKVEGLLADEEGKMDQGNQSNDQ